MTARRLSPPQTDRHGVHNSTEKATEANYDRMRTNVHKPDKIHVEALYRRNL